jgi:XTP/dITP diphosphohydrolase
MKLVIASHNAGKVGEIGLLLRPYNIEVISAATLGLGEPEETGTCFIANAELKARAAAQAANLPALADDSGLVVDALGGDPGIYSARWAGPTQDFALAMQKVLLGLGERDQRSARFICALSLAWPDGRIRSFEGKVEGVIARQPRGSQGFGYDPIFVPAGSSLTFGEMDAVQKQSISHRTHAFAQLVKACFE